MIAMALLKPRSNDWFGGHYSNMQLGGFYFYSFSGTRGGVINVLVLEILPYDFLLDAVG